MLGVDIFAQLERCVQCLNILIFHKTRVVLYSLCPPCGSCLITYSFYFFFFSFPVFYLKIHSYFKSLVKYHLFIQYDKLVLTLEQYNFLIQLKKIQSFRHATLNLTGMPKSLSKISLLSCVSWDTYLNGAWHEGFGNSENF